MYLYQFSMKKIPFGQTPDTELFCPTPTHTEALNVLLFAINTGEVFCKIIGEIGSGKTMLCRLLIREMEKTRRLAYIPNPNLTVKSLHYTLAKELGLRIKKNTREDQLIQSIQNRIIKLNKTHGPVVLIIDEAQAMSDEVLEAIRLFTNIETEDRKLLQIVMFAQPELNKKLNQHNLRQLKQRISFSYQLQPLTANQVLKYIDLRVSKVSLQQPIKFSVLASLLVYFFSKGTPRLINILCHKALLLTYSKKLTCVNAANVYKAAIDTDSIDRFILYRYRVALGLALLSISGTALAFWGG